MGDGAPSVWRALLATMVVLAVSVLAFLHIAFGLANFQPGYPKLEGVAAIIAGMALFAALILVWRSVFLGLVIACLGTLPLAAWFCYAVPVEGSSDLGFLWASLVIPASTGLAALVLRGRTMR